MRLTSQSLHHALNRTVNQAIPKAINDGLVTLNQETERISTITEKIRALLRNAQTKTEPVDLIQVIESSVRYVESNHSNQRWFDRKPLQQISDEDTVIQGDAIQLQLALINLFKNAVEALTSEPKLSGQDEKSPVIRVSLHRNGQQWIIDVDDNGPGISAERLSDLTLMSSKPEGSGLGLFLVRSAAEGHGGDLALSPSPLGGLRARITLPIRTVA